jgi:uncharacterized protein with HEPN domain
LHLKSAPKWLVIPALILVTLSALMLASTTAAQDAPAAKEKTEDLFSLFQTANATVTEVFRQFQAVGKTIPQASLNQRNQAFLLAEESRNLLQAGNYSEADNKIIEALQKLKEALRTVYTTFPEQTPETDFDRAAQLKSAITRHYEQLQQIENLTCTAASAGYNTTKLEANIQAVKSLLETASNNVDEKRFEAATSNLAEAKNRIDTLLNSVNTFATDLKTQRLQTYITQTEARLAAIREKAEAVSNTAVLAALENAETSLDNAKDYLSSQQINETLSALANSRASEEEAVEYLEASVSSRDSTSSAALNAVQPP